MNVKKQDYEKVLGITISDSDFISLEEMCKNILIGKLHHSQFYKKIERIFIEVE